MGDVAKSRLGLWARPVSNVATLVTMMRFKEVAARLTGISTPIVGLSWTPATLDRDVAVRTLAFLEDRRALYADYGLEDPEHIAHSIIEIRRYLTDAIGTPGINDDLKALLRQIRAACLDYLNSTWSRRGFVPEDGSSATWELPAHRGPYWMEALGRLRGVVGICVGTLAAKYQVDLEEGLSNILPSHDSGQ